MGPRMGRYGALEGLPSSRGIDTVQQDSAGSLLARPTALHPRAERPQVPVRGELLLRTQPRGEGHVDVHEGEQE